MKIKKMINDKEGSLSEASLILCDLAFGVDLESMLLTSCLSLLETNSQGTSLLVSYPHVSCKPAFHSLC